MLGRKTRLIITELIQESYMPKHGQEIPCSVSKQQKRNLLTFHVAYPPRFMVSRFVEEILSTCYVGKQGTLLMMINYKTNFTILNWQTLPC